MTRDHFGFEYSQLCLLRIYTQLLFTCEGNLSSNTLERLMDSIDFSELYGVKVDI
jgi:hypothetical protein